MLNGAFSLSSDPRDLGIQRGDTRVKLFYGKRVKILTSQRSDGIVGALG
jgi:hypothetical protein